VVAINIIFPDSVCAGLKSNLLGEVGVDAAAGGKERGGQARTQMVVMIDSRCNVGLVAAREMRRGMENINYI